MANILIVDDQPFLQEVLSEDLADEDYRIECVGDADSALSFLHESQPDVILLDLYLRGFEGWDLLDEIKRVSPSVPVLIVSAYDNFVHDPRVNRADGYVIKDVQTEKLRQKIAEVQNKAKIGGAHVQNSHRR